MVSAIGSSLPYSSASVPTATGGLDAQLAQCQVQLSDWVHCVSAKTPEGKAKIEEISNKIDDIKAQMQKADVGRSNSPLSAPSKVESVPRPESATVGNLLNVFA